MLKSSEVDDAAGWIPSVIEAIRSANTDGPVADIDKDVLSGLSGTRVIGALQRLAALHSDEEDVCYLEIGVFQGLTLLSVANALPGLDCFGIDNFSQLDPDGENIGIVQRRMKKLGVSNAHLINLDFEAALESLPEHIGQRKVAAFFIDGAHDYRSQLMCLMLAAPYLHDRAAIVIDDANYVHVRQANRDFLLTQSEFRLVYEGYTPTHPDNMDRDTLKRARQGWWNGVNIIVRDPGGDLPVALPPTRDDHTVFFNDHLVHRVGMAELAADALRMAQKLATAELEDLSEDADRFRGLAQAHDERYRKEERYADKNTYSADLPESRFNLPAA